MVRGMKILVDMNLSPLKRGRQSTNRFGFLTSYTWSKSIDDGSGIFPFSQPNGLAQG